MKISFFADDVSIPKLLKRNKLREVLAVMQKQENVTFDFINYIFCSDESLLAVNRQYLQHDYYTDIITFPYESEDGVASDIFISLDRIKDHAREYGQGFDSELHRIVLHGALHLAGFDDKEEALKIIMTQKEDEYLRLIFAT